MRKRPKKKLDTPKLPTLTGILRVHPRGFGFVVPNNPEESAEDIFIPKHLTNSAVDGDEVEVTVSPSQKPGKGPEGEILSVVSRGRTHVAGIIDVIEEGRILAFVPVLGEAKIVSIAKQKDQQLEVGERVILKIVEWGTEKKPTICEISHKIGHIEDPSCDIEAAVQEFSLQEKFPTLAIKEVKIFGDEVQKKDLKGRLDLSKTECFTIDPETAKDFDDALSISKDRKGHFFLGVHIADVAHYVSPGSALDAEALRRGNSTYFPGKCIPMLPEELSNNLCSLKQGVNRLTVSVLMEFDTEGTLVGSQIKRSFINSQKRFTYGEALTVLEGKKKSPHLQALGLLVELCKLLKHKRYFRGSIDFALPDMILLIDKNGQPTGVKIEEYDITHQLVEECMLKANEVVAKNLSDRGKHVLYRVHEEPAPENLEEFFSIARMLGFQIPSNPTHEDLQELFEKAKGSPFSQQLAVSFIRNLRLAMYSPSNVGHYGLALEHYCHFTSPIRRYSDLVTERLLFNEEEEDLNLEKIAQICSEKERISFKAEMNVKQLKKLRLLKYWQEENPDKEYEAHITKIKPYGLYFEIKELFLEGFLHISELENDYFIYDANLSMLQGEKTGIRHVIGSPLQVRPITIDLIHLETRWELVFHGKRKKKSR